MGKIQFRLHLGLSSLAPDLSTFHFLTDGVVQAVVFYDRPGYDVGLIFVLESAGLTLVSIRALFDISQVGWDPRSPRISIRKHFLVMALKLVTASHTVCLLVKSFTAPLQSMNSCPRSR